jgi:hypothetical protein
MQTSRQSRARTGPGADDHSLRHGPEGAAAGRRRPGGPEACRHAHVSNAGRFVADSADKGEKLYEVQTGRTGIAPPTTLRNRRPFLGGVGRNTGTGSTDAKVDYPPMLFVFALEGKAELPTPSSATSGGAGALACQPLRYFCRPKVQEES